MTIHMPTTEEVKHDYAWDGYLDAPLTSREDRFDIWHAAEIRRAKEAAWDEAFSAGWEECHEFHQCGNNNPELRDADTVNPYRGASS